MMAMPNGCLNSAPMPVPNASGIAPKSEASVVINIGRKRNNAAS